ncbi:MAG TPA: hypothetical protein VMP68_21670 [Candidatus Eisenbacteria bacterium]|nr:hypothetical protein [Candidatus Eisenbacteria bacterium]
MLRLNFVGPFANGFLLTINDSSASYAIIRYNIRTYRSAGVVAVIGGKDQAELELKKFEDAQDSSDRHEGWRYLIDKTDLKAGTDPAEATLHRQAELEKRESKAMRDPESPDFPSQHRQR